MKPLCKVPTIPHKKLLVGRDGLNGVEVDVHPVLTRSQVLLPGRVRRIHIAHPVAFFLIKAIDEVEKLPSGVDLSKQKDRRVKESQPQSNDKLPRHLREETQQELCVISHSLLPTQKKNAIGLARVVLNQQKSGRKQVRHTLSVTFSISVLSSLHVGGKMTEEWNTTFHLRSCLGRIKPPESITFATAATGKWAKLLTLVPIMLTLNALSHWVEDQANRIRQTESQLFLWPLYLPFPTPPPKA